MSDLGIFEYSLLLGGGFFAGIINTLAGYGSVICLTLLMDVVGLPANVANGSNRINVLANATASTIVFYKNGKIDLSKSKGYILITLVGAFVGVYTATVVSNEAFRGIFKYLVIILFALLLIKPARWLREHSEDYRPSQWLIVPGFLFIGFYGGFIQMGVGLFILSLLVIGARYNLIEANALKIILTGIYNIFVLFIFWWKDLIAWEAGLVLAVGAYVGGWITSTFASKYKKANLWAYRLLVAILVFIILYQFNILSWLFG